MRVSHNPESPRGDRGNGPETRPGVERSGCNPKPMNPLKGNPRPLERGGGQIRCSSVGIHFCLIAESYFVLDSIKPLKELIEGIKPIIINMFNINMDLEDGRALVLMGFQAGDPGLESTRVLLSFIFYIGLSKSYLSVSYFMFLNKYVGFAN